MDDAPLKIAILGGGPIGIEATLYARYLGCEVTLFERGSVAENIKQWGHVRLFSPFRMNRSTLGLGALSAQSESYQPPGDETILTGREYVAQYLLPLSQTDLVRPSLREQTTVLGVARKGFLKTEKVGEATRNEESFQLLVRDETSGEERNELADIVIDATGVFGNRNALGNGGLPAIGETGCRHKIEDGLPDVLGKDRETYAGKHTLVVGSGYSAATTVVAFAALAKEEPETQVTWVTRRTEASLPPITTIENDSLSQRATLSAEANALAGDPKSIVDYWPATTLQKIHWREESSQFEVTLSGKHDTNDQPGVYHFDRIIAHVGFHPNLSIYRELQVHQCYASEGPMKLAAALSGNTSADCLDQTSTGPATLTTSEADFYILGSKSYGRNSRFLISLGLEQIREVFTLIGERENLNLYAAETC